MTEAIRKFRRTKYTCYYTYLAMSSIFVLPPMLFVTFREMYGISYTLLGTLVLLNFTTQFTVDLIFTFFSKHFNIKRTVQFMPLLTSLGLLIYAILPMVVPQYTYAGLVTGTILFSIAAGLSEVLLSPTVAALPSDNPERDMSALHSLFAYGVLMTVVVSTIFLKVFGAQNWMYLAMFWAVLPVISFILFSTSPMPEIEISHSGDSAGKKARNGGIVLCVLCIFFGSAAENAMTDWISSFMENAMQIPKAVGDIVGMASFAVLLGLTRTWYAKYGKNIYKVILVSMAGAAVCYLIVGLVSNVVICMITCILTGMFTSMLWPGTLILMEEKIPGAGVAAYALMAAGGDFGAAVAPQLLGIVVDEVSVAGWAGELAPTLAMTTEQLGMKTGMLINALFPILGVCVLLYMKKYFAKQNALGKK